VGCTQLVLHHVIAPSRSSHLIQGFLAKYGIAPPDMAPYDFWLFPRSKTPLKGSRWRSCTPFQNKPLKKCFQRWKNRWAKCVESQGVYFEWD
jgi:hypothetical protein